jgi:hypothetical protein
MTEPDDPLQCFSRSDPSVMEVWPEIDVLTPGPRDRVLHVACKPCGRSVVLVGRARSADPNNPPQLWPSPHAGCNRMNRSDLPEVVIQRALTP